MWAPYTTGIKQFNNFCQRLGIPPMLARFRDNTVEIRSTQHKDSQSGDYQGVFVCSASLSHTDSLRRHTPNDTSSALGSMVYKNHKRLLKETTSVPDHVASPQLCQRDKLMYWTAFTTAFFSFMYVSEFTEANDTSFDEWTLCEKVS